MPIKAVFFDVANTLLHKPGLVPAIAGVLDRHGVLVSPAELFRQHRLLSELVVVPDQTTPDFYREFNASLLRLFGILPTASLLDEIYACCKPLPWAPFSDLDALGRIPLPMGVLSNWDRSLPEQLARHVPAQFNWILGSAELGVRKPDPAFFGRMLAATALSPADLLYVGDSIRLDIEPALRLGLKVALIDRENLYSCATVPRIRRLDELMEWL